MRRLDRFSSFVRRAAVALAALLLCLQGASAPGAAQDSPERQAARAVAQLCEAGKLPEAARVACEWAAEEPGSIPALRACGELGAAAGLSSHAEEALRSLLFYTPSDPDTLVLLGNVLLDRGLYAEAREQFEAAVQLDGISGPAYTGLARASIYDAQSSGDMLSAAEVAVAIAPDYGPAHAAMGAALREVGRLDDAVEALEQAREIDPDDAEAAYELGVTWSLLGDADRAQEAWRRVVELRPFGREAWLLRNHLVITRTEPILDRAFNAQYSPDGTRIAYRARGEGGWGIYTIPAEGPVDETRLWATEANVQALAWRPDGSSIAVSMMEKVEVNGKQQWTRKLLLIPAEGGEAKLVTEDRYLGDIAWDPSNGRIAVRSYVRRRGYAIVEIDPETGASEPVPGLTGRKLYLAPAWSRDGSMLFVARRGDALPDGSFPYDLMVGPADDFAGAQVLYTAPELPRGPVFTPDGSAVLFALPGADRSHYSIWALPLDGSREPVLVDHRASSYVMPSFSKDGHFMLTARATMLNRATLVGLTEG